VSQPAAPPPPEGAPAPPEPAGRPPLGQWLVERGLVSPEQVEAALEEQARTGARLGEILVAQGAIYDTDLAHALAELSGLPFRDLDVDPPDLRVAGLLPEQFCRRRCVLPVEADGSTIVIAIADPRDVLTFDDLRMIARHPVALQMAEKNQLRRAIDAAFQSVGLASADAGLEGAQDVGGQMDDDVAAQIQLESEEEPQVRFVSQLLRRALDDRASDVHLEPSPAGLRIRFRVDGALRELGCAPRSMQDGVIGRLKVMAGIDIAKPGQAQDGRMSLNADGRPVDVRVSSLPAVNGEVLVLRLLDKSQGILSLDELGFLDSALASYREACQSAWGLIAVSGPTGSGKSTTLYATVSELNSESVNTVTVEDPVEYRIPGIKQTQVNRAVGYTFASGLRAALRADPDIILIGEIRDAETAHVAAQAAMTGHLVLSTLHANDSASTATRLTDMGVEPYLVASALKCVVAQRLLRRLCQRCRHSYEPDAQEAEVLARLGLDPFGLPLWRAEGCAECGRTGYRGRIAAFEVMTMTSAIRAAIVARASSEEIAAEAQAAGMQPLRADAFAKVMAGLTSLAELVKVVG